MRTIDLNSDLGESFGAYSIGMDSEILSCVSSANIACGFHAGDPVVMEKTVRLAAREGAAIGAHPGYPDLQGFGRRNMNLSPAEVRAMITYQLGALDAFVRTAGLRLQHIKTHGALYNTAAKDEKLARAVAEAAAVFRPDLIVLAQAGSCMEAAAREAGLPFAAEVFADRAYNDDGSLVSRSMPGAVLHNEEEVLRRTVRMVRDGEVVTVNGKVIPIRADSICVHGDTPEALAFVQRIRAALEAEGIRIEPLGARR